MSHYLVGTSHAESQPRVITSQCPTSHCESDTKRVIQEDREVRPHSRNQNIPSPPSMNLDSVPPVRPLLTHVIADEPLRREAGISRAPNHADLIGLVLGPGAGADRKGRKGMEDAGSMDMKQQHNRPEKQV